MNNHYTDIQQWIASEYDELELDIWRTVGMHPRIVAQAVVIQSQTQDILGNEWSPSAKLFLIKKHHELTLA